jgi:hypothetical protein
MIRQLEFINLCLAWRCIKVQFSPIDYRNLKQFIEIPDFNFLQHSALKITVFCSKVLRQCKVLPAIMPRLRIIYLFILTNIYSCGQTIKTKQTSNPSVTSTDVSIRRDTFKYFSIADTNFSKYALPDKFKKPPKWIKADEERKGMLGDPYGSSYPDTFKLTDALEIIDTAIQLSEIGSAKSWCIHNYRQAFPYLVTRLSDKRKIGLKNTADLIIWDRIGSGDLQFYGHGGGMDEDIFTIAGRASWILNQLTGENFAVVYGNLTEQDATKFKSIWMQYLSKLKK